MPVFSKINNTAIPRIPPGIGSESQATSAFMAVDIRVNSKTCKMILTQTGMTHTLLLLDSSLHQPFS
jgi:hypothetical protein